MAEVDDSLSARSEQLQILEIDQHQQVEYPNDSEESEYVTSKLIDSPMDEDKALPKAEGSATSEVNNPEILKAIAISLPMTEPGENTNSDNNKKMLQDDSTSIVEGPICEVEGHSGPSSRSKSRPHSCSRRPTEHDQEAQSPHLDAYFLNTQYELVNILGDIRFSLKRIETRLVPHSKKNVNEIQIHPIDSVRENALESTGAFRGPDRSEEEIPPTPATVFYVELPSQVDYSDVPQTPPIYNNINELKEDFPLIISSPPSDDIPKVQDNSWKYYAILKKSGTVNYRVGGSGKHNFVAPWNAGPGANEDQVLKARYLYVPYSQTYYMGALEGSRMINGRFTHYTVAQHHILTTEERSECTKHLGGLWTLPPDRRVSFGFQEYRLQREEYPSLCAQDLGRRLAALTELGGTFEVIDTDVWSPDNHDIDLSSFRNGSFKYFQESQLTARDAEILVLNIRPRLLDTEEPDYTYSANWVREVFIHGYAYVFDKSALMARYEQLSPGGGELGQLFELHVDCQLCSTRQYLTKGLALFHIVWMDVQKFNEETPEPISPRWARNKIPGLKGYSIGSVSYSALYMSEPYKSDGWWTALTMQPLFDSRGKVGETSPAELDFNTTEERSMMITAFRTIHHAMSSALSSWENVANRLEEILVLDSTHDTVLSRDRFLHPENCFWVINVVQPIESMILNTTEQWDLFYAHACSNFQPAVYRRPERYRERLAVIIEDIEQSCSKLQALPARFREIREKAKTLRDGHLNLITIESARANLKEAKQGSKMGSRIALLTYVTVFYLPLALCTSMWSINDMFGTGVLGFCIVTSAVSLLTYSITILLLNLDVKKYVKARRGARGDKGLKAVPLSPELSPRSPEGSGDLEQQMTASTAFKTPASITERESTIKRRLLSSLFGRKKAGINDQEKGGIL